MCVRTVEDVQHPTFGAGEIPCLFCKFELPLRWFGRRVTFRGGLPIVQCYCPMCERTWRRVEC
ncbi:hypothetical protein SAMN04488061_2866 [Filomicrobium insigne]|uniref:Uncharacterized protein n=1 Tax=Filomicrobium insigne TaxID=418854 RepID=A0A1H0SFE8_9HYPH|nr:hypothetical protein SAMN04488061_2866 [Filomicrobium insigne]